MSIQVTYETNHISLLHDSTMLNALIFVFYVFTCEVSIIIILIYQKLGSVGPIQQKIKLPLPYSAIENILSLVSQVVSVLKVISNKSLL